MTRSRIARAVWLTSVISMTSACTQTRTASEDASAPRPAVTRDYTGKTLAEVFQGRAGVQVTSMNGGVRLRIRGAGEWDGRGDPLYVIDGVPTEPPGGILILNPNDIASVEILKDDASTSIYGLKGANGVVKIALKRKG